jgi:hypothetical protein
MIINTELSGNNRITLTLNKIKASAEQALFEATKEAGSSISKHIKNDLLNGQMLYDTTGFPRASSTTSLQPGELRKAVFVTPWQSGGQARVTVGIRGSSHVKEVAKWLQEGRTGPWQIPSELPNPTGKQLHMLLRIGDKPETPEFDDKFASSFDHPGYKSHPFLRKGVEDRISYFKQLAQRMVRQAIK